MFLIYILSATIISSQDVLLDLNEIVTLGWTFREENITLYLEVKFIQCRLESLGWCGIGFGDSMENTDMVYISNFNQNITVADLYSEDNELPPVDASLGGTQDWTLIDWNIEEEGTITGIITRKLNTEDEYDEVLYENIVSEFSYAYQHADYFAFHEDNYGFGEIKLASSQNEAYYEEFRKFGDPYWEHGVYMSCIWMCIIPLAILTARYFKWNSYWFYIHSFLGVVAIFFTIQSAESIYDEHEAMDYTFIDEERLHAKVGLGLTTLLVAQGLLGVLTAIFKLTDTSLSILMATRKLHKITGTSLLVMSILSVNSGWKVYGENESVVIGLYVLGIILFVMFEIRHQLRFLLPSIKFQPLILMKEKESLIPETSSYEEIGRKIELKRKMWVFCDEWVLDVSDWMKHHPGGKKLVKKIVGLDAGKYINGSSSILGNLNPYEHPETVATVIDGLVIGKVGFASEILKPVGNESYESMKWTFAKQYKVCETTYCLEFTSSKWEIERPEGVKWFGKHFLVGKLVSKRYYSFVEVNMEEWRKELKDEGYWVEREPIEEDENSLNLYIKPYNLGKISTYLTNLKLGDQVYFKGPMGPGLLLESFPNGKVLTFAAGTGVLPYIDFLYYIWTENVPESFELYLYLTFTSKEDIFALDLVKAVQAKYSEQINLWVNVDKDQENYDGFIGQEKLQKWVDLEKVEKIWVCGPSGFNLWIERMIVESGLPKDAITML